MNADLRLILVASIGIAFLAWGVAYYKPIGALGMSGAQDYTTFLRGLEPASLGGSGGTIPTAPPTGYGG